MIHSSSVEPERIVLSLRFPWFFHCYKIYTAVIAEQASLKLVVLLPYIGAGAYEPPVHKLLIAVILCVGTLL